MSWGKMERKRCFGSDAQYVDMFAFGGRFASRSSLDELSLWLRPHAKVYDKFGQLQRDLTQFFRNTELKVSHCLPAFVLVHRLCECACACVCVCVCVCARARVCLSIRLYVCLSVCLSVCAYEGSHCNTKQRCIFIYMCI